MSNFSIINKTNILFIFLITINLYSSDSLPYQFIGFHFQQTIISQYKPPFNAIYSGSNSISTKEENQISVTSTFFIGCRLQSNTELFINPELSGGQGLSGVVGVAGFPNGEIYRVGNPKPEVSFARIFLRHTYNLSNDFDTINDEQNHIPGIRSKSYLAFTLGKFSLSDIFDNNSFCHDPRTQFMNWSIMSSGAWDYPANTKGYTLGMAMELVNQTDWALRLAAVMVVTDANHSTFDTKIDKANGLCAEIMKKYTLFNSFGFIRLLGFVNHARMGNYNEAIQIKTDTVDITKTRAYGRAKFGFGLNIEQQLNDKTGLFLRTSWNDGQTETWAFTEIDRSLSIGAQFHGGLWGRETDRIGLACVLNGISVEHRNYLASGGYGFIIGDGKLNYGLETIFETYYSFFIHDADHFWFTPDYQFIINPAYNKDRGPVHTLSLRIHIEF